MERATRVPQLIFPAAGMNMIDGPTAENGKGYKVSGLSTGRPGEISRQTGKTLTGKLSKPVMGFIQFFSPLGFFTNVQQTGYDPTGGVTSPGEVTGETILIQTGSTSVPQYLGYTTSDGTVMLPFTYDDDVTGSVTQVTDTQWYADYTSSAKNPSCVDVTLEGTLGPLVGEAPFTDEMNACVDILACGIQGRGIKITSADNIETCYLTGAGFLSFDATYRADAATWNIVINGPSGTLLDTIVPSLTEPELILP